MLYVSSDIIVVATKKSNIYKTVTKSTVKGVSNPDLYIYIYIYIYIYTITITITLLFGKFKPGVSC